MQATNQEMIRYFAQHLPVCSHQYDYQYWANFRQKVLADNPTLSHDVAALRFHTYLMGIKALGKTDMQANTLAHNAMAQFNFHRSNFVVPKETHQLLKALSKKLPLVAITNGNVNTETIGIAHYFRHIYHADLSKQQKPSSAMFMLACKDLAIATNELLHVGDCGHSDIYGANKAGCQSAWVSNFTIGKPLTTLPDIALSNVTALKALV